jgi:hypothetical protein
MVESVDYEQYNPRERQPDSSWYWCGGGGVLRLGIDVEPGGDLWGEVCGGPC